MKKKDPFFLFSPFTKRPGQCFIIPKTSLFTKIFPTAIFFYLEKKISKLTWLLEGEVTHFVAFLDLQKHRILLQAQNEKQKISFALSAKEQKIYLTLLSKDLPRNLSLNEETICLKPNQPFLLFENIEEKTIDFLEKLYLGVDKLPAWEKIAERKNLKEILPIWYHLSQITPIDPSVDQKKLPSSLEALGTLFKSRFTGVFAPREKDEDFWGDGLPPLSKLSLLSPYHAIIRNLFFVQKENHLFFLPTSLKNFPMGKMHLNTPIGKIFFSWSKRKLFSIRIVPLYDGSIYLHSPEITSATLRQGEKDRGSCYYLKEKLTLYRNQELIIDRFQK